MLHIGCHLSASDGYLAMGKEALDLNADTFAFFTRNPRGGSAKSINPSDSAAFRSLAAEHHFAPLVAHAPYTMNCCSLDPHLREFARDMLVDDLVRMEHTPNCFYNFHPGSHVQQGTDVGIEYIAQTLAAVLKPEQTTTVLLETMAGKGSEVGRTFDEIRSIINRTEELLEATTDPTVQASGSDTPKIGGKLGVCFDTCHVWDGGYDIVNNLDDVLTEFDKIVGFSRLKAVHLNDSMNPLGAHKDRHQKIGEGYIGLEALIRVINHPVLKNLPFILETPNEHDGYKHEISVLRDNYRG